MPSWLERDHGVSLAFQDIAAELAAWPGRYAPPRGALLLALGPATPAGTVALRPLDAATCEIKRLYVTPAARGAGLGAAPGRRHRRRGPAPRLPPRRPRHPALHGRRPAPLRRTRLPRHRPLPRRPPTPSLRFMALDLETRTLDSPARLPQGEAAGSRGRHDTHRAEVRRPRGRAPQGLRRLRHGRRSRLRDLARDGHRPARRRRRRDRARHALHRPDGRRPGDPARRPARARRRPDHGPHPGDGPRLPRRPTPPRRSC